MIPLAVLDILADDWVRTRQESARRFGNRESRVVGWFAAVQGRFGHRDTVALACRTPAAPPAAPRRAA